MRKAFVLIFLLATAGLFAEGLKFRGLELDKATFSDVVIKEGEPERYDASSPDGIIVYEYKNKKVAGYNADEMEFYFLKDKLIGGMYRLYPAEEKLGNGMQNPTETTTIFIDIFNKLKKIYGEPDSLYLPRDFKNELPSDTSVKEFFNGVSCRRYFSIWKKEKGYVYMAIRIYEECLCIGIAYYGDTAIGIIQKENKEREQNIEGL